MYASKNFSAFTLYRIYYDDAIVYLGRTMQPLQDRIRGHLFKQPTLRAIDINKVSKIEYATFQTQADMYLYEVYYINLWKPTLNRDNKVHDSLTISLPDVSWNVFTTPFWEKWKAEIQEKDEEINRMRQKAREFNIQNEEMRAKKHAGEITEVEYLAWLQQMGIF